MKKNLISLLVLFFVSGCTAEYNIEINEDTIYEDTKLSIDNIRLNETLYNELLNDNSVYLDENKFYSIEEQSAENNTIFSYKYTHDIDKFGDSRIINWCYHDRSIINTDNELLISTKGSFDCANRESRSYIENARINIKTDLPVLANNADEVNGNVYTWIVNEDNYRDKPIYIRIQKNTNELESNSIVYLIFIIIVLVILATLIALIIKRKIKNVNKL